jgi:hypothetical protein
MQCSQRPCFPFLNPVTHEKKKKKKKTKTGFKSQLQEAGRARAGAPTPPELAEGRRELVFARDERDPPLPRAIRVPDGAADRRRVQIVAQGLALRHGHDEDRERPRAGRPRTLAPRRADAGPSRRVRLRAGEDGGEEETVDGGAHLGLAQRSVRRARKHLRARVVHLALSQLRRARRGCDRTRCVHTLEDCSCILQSSIRYV